jgi:hypothetical protein
VVNDVVMVGCSGDGRGFVCGCVSGVHIWGVGL